MNAYEQKQAARKARLERAAATAGASAAALSMRASAIAAMIPFGQPILVGHHSERRHRRDASRIGALHTKAHEARTEAADLARRAAVVGTAGISSDDPDAIAKLEAELIELRRKQALMTAVNAALRKTAKAGREAQIAALAAAGWHVRPIEVIEAGGFPRFKLTNNGANIRRVERRIAELRAKVRRVLDALTGERPRSTQTLMPQSPSQFRVILAVVLGVVVGLLITTPGGCHGQSYGQCQGKASAGGHGHVR